MSSLSASKPREYSAQVSFLPARFVLMDLPTLKSTIIIMAHLWGFCIQMLLSRLCPLRINILGSSYLCYDTYWTFCCFTVLTSMNDKLLNLFVFGIAILAWIRATWFFPFCRSIRLIPRDVNTYMCNLQNVNRWINSKWDLDMKCFRCSYTQSMW